MVRVGADADVLVAGGDIAGLEAALALRTLAPQALVRLLSRERWFTYLPAAPLAVVRPELEPVVPLADLLEGTGIALQTATLAGVRADRRVAFTEAGVEFGYGHLVVAVGARREPYLGNRALTFRGPCDAPAVRELVDEVSLAASDGVRSRLAFVVPPGPGWPLPAYELALLASALLTEDGVRERVGIAVVTAEAAPLGLFGRVASDAVADDLADAGIELWTGAPVGRFAAGRIELIPGEVVEADRVVALPVLRGPGLAGLPADGQGFIRTDALGRVRGAPRVFAVGDGAAFPVKHGGLACAQAEAATRCIARALGATVPSLPPDQTLRAFLKEGEQDRYLRSDPVGGGDDSAGVTRLLAPKMAAVKVAGRYLPPLLERRMPQLRLRGPWPA